ncbi:hypothetical protein HAL1_03972 [Halomonas sp. HAL1]|nr:hypothetical protein HAL1_03972 [Halomonas sp. HAL1]
MVLDADGKPELIEESRPLDLPLYRFPVFGLLGLVLVPTRSACPTCNGHTG